MDQPPGMTNGRPEDEIHLRDVWGLLVRNWLVIGFSLMAVVGATAAYTFYQIPVYESATTIRIEEERTDLPVLDVLQTLSTGSEVETEMEVVRSRTLAESVVESLALQVSVLVPRGVARVTLMHSVVVERWAPEAVYILDRVDDRSYTVTDEELGTTVGTTRIGLPASLPGATFTLTEAAAEHDQIVVSVESFEKAVENLQGTLGVSRPNREAAIVTVRYESTDTQLVHLVPNTLAERFIARGQTIRKTEATSTVGFLEEQIDTLESQLREAEQSLTTFRETEQVVSLEAEAEAQVTNVARLQADRNVIDAERSALRALVDQITREAATADPTEPSPFAQLITFPTLFRNQAASELLRTLNEAHARRSQLLIRRTMQDPDVINVTEEIQRIEEQLRTTATTYLQGLENQVAGYDDMLTRVGSELESIPEQQIQQIRFERQVTVLSDIFTLLQERLQEARILEAVDDATMRVVDPAILPSEPLKPRKTLNLLLGIILGGMLGVGVAFTREYMDQSVHTREDIIEATGGAPVLGMIPRIRQLGRNGKRDAAAMIGGAGELGARLVAGRDPRNPVSEAYRSLRTNLTFSNLEKPPKTIVFTSPLPQDGKSTTAANLCITLAQQGLRTLLVDADLRRGVLNGVFGVARDPGLTDVLVGQASPAEAIQEIDLGESGTLSFLPSGPYPPNPAEILGSERMRSLVKDLEERFELIIIDSAPLTLVTDAAVLGTKADGVVLVSRANVTEKGAVRYSVEQLRHVRAPVLGAILNDVDYARDSRYYSTYGKYGYYHHFYDDDDKKGKKKKT